MKKKISLFIGIFGIALLGLGLYLGLTESKNLDNNENQEIRIEVVNKKYIKNCLNDGCSEKDDLYAHLSINSENKVLNDSIKTINGNTDYYYDYILNSQYTICDEKVTSYAYRRGISNEYYYYINDDYITFSASRAERDFCDNTVVTMPVETYIYSKKADKILMQDEFQKELGYNDSELDSFITNYLEKDNKDFVRDSYYGKALYYNSEGKLYISFSWNEYDFMSILVK